MNFLAHLHCSPNQELVRVFNFTGDGFRGNHWKSHATDVMIIGVELHRFIDSYTDAEYLAAEEWFIKFYPELILASEDFIFNHPLINK